MPSHTAACALIKLYAVGGAPWQWPTWQKLTGICHGLFPQDDKDLPPGWTRKDAEDIESYFTGYLNQGSEEDMQRFSKKSGTPAYPGRNLWNSYVQKMWSRWKIHAIIVDELKAADIHPQDILIRENDPHLTWPNADSYLPQIFDSLGLRIFGDEAFPDGSEVLRSALRAPLRMLIQRSWTSIRVHVGNIKKRAAEREAVARAAFKELEDGPAMKAQINRTLRAVAKWKECALLLYTPENVRKADEMLAAVQEMMEKLGAKVTKKKTVSSSRRICKVPEKALKILASEEDVSDLLNIYHEYFEAYKEDEADHPIAELDPDKATLLDEDGDFGMEMEAKVPTIEFWPRLGFKDGLPVSFNSHRHRAGITPWQDLSAFQLEPYEVMPEPLMRLRLHWHQVAGVHSIIRKVFAKAKDPAHTTGVLVGDEVGLGKTAQCITVIAFLNQMIFLQKYNKKLPAVVAERPFLGDSEKIPSLPHLIICPGTLIEQWKTELMTLFLPRSVDILTYDSQTDPKVFWGLAGPLHSSKHEFHHRVIIASHSVVFNDFKKAHYPSSKKARPWDFPKERHSLASTIFRQQYLTVSIDEAHHMRNPGNKHLAALRLARQAKIKLIMTATPLHTAPKDIAALARLVGVPYFFTEDSHTEEKADIASLRRLKKLDDDGAAVRAEKVVIVRRLQKHIIHNFLHRTSKSVNYLGDNLLPLPPCMDIIGLLTLTEREMEIMKDRAESAKADIMSSSNARIVTKQFYMEYRLAVSYAKEDPASLLPTFETLDEWLPKKSTKMDVCARICAHYLEHDDIDDVSFEGGVAIFPLTTPPKGKITRERRIIIYAEFPSMAPLLQNVLRLYSVESLAINGKISFDQRDKRVKQFHKEDSKARVLVFSSIGSAGLNLSIADIVIFFDQPWSAQDEAQIKGRAHWQPQYKHVKAIHLLAIDTADTVMYEVAQEKQDMFDAFVNKELKEDLRGLLKGEAPDIEEELDDPDLESVSVPKPKPKLKRRYKKRIIVEDDPPLAAETVSPLQTDAGATSDGGLSGTSGSMLDHDSEYEAGGERQRSFDETLEVNRNEDIEMRPPPQVEPRPPALLAEHAQSASFEDEPDQPASFTDERGQLVPDPYPELPNLGDMNLDEPGYYSTDEANASYDTSYKSM
ncbi:SWI/SNF-like matrix-associated actin-dependent regulator [Leucoagaricus sp. SymC.cos]|nr:SWI/SNF-like matrix-associated actin-dependent regulator [Leucoagaricus sp. SymC.cos]